MTKEVLHTAHDVERLGHDCDAMLSGIQKLGASVNVEMLKASAEPFALMRLLVLKGVCTEEEARAEVLLRMKDQLAVILQQVEEQVAKRTSGPEIEQVHKPRLLIAK